MDVLLQNAVIAAQKLYSNANDLAVSIQFEGTLESLTTATRDPMQCSRLSKDDISLIELLGYCPIMLSANYTSVSLRSQLHSFLYNIAWSNIPLRSYMSGEMELCSAVFTCLKHSLKQETGPKSLMESLKLLQVLTYDVNMTLSASWADGLITFLLTEVCRSNETEWTPLCLGTLNNVATRFPFVREKIKRSSSYSTFCRRIVSFLSHNSTFVVICSLSLVSFWEDKLKDTVYSSKNLPQTFQCLFNVLVKGDSFMARHIAVDLVSRLITDDDHSMISRLRLSQFGESLVNFSHRDRCIQQVAALIVSLERYVEQLSKVYDLLLLFCSYESLRRPTCSLIMNSEPVDQNRLTTPLLAMVQTAKMAPRDSLLPDTPMKAAKLLRLVLQEVGETNERIENFLPPETLLNLIESCVKTTVETGHSHVTYQCCRIVEGIRLAQVASLDDGLRNDLLEVVAAPFCAHIAEFQLLTNPVGIRVNRKSSYQTDLPEWSDVGVEILMELLELLALLKDHCKSHKDRYWKLLKDERLVPFLAYAMTCGRKQVVHGALKLVVHCSQVQAFPCDWLGELIATNVGRQQQQSVKTDSSPGLSLTTELQASMSNGLSANSGKEPVIDDEMIDQLIKKMKSGMNLKDVTVSQLVQVYERKIANLEAKDRQLQEFVNTKDTMLQQSERIVSQYKGQKTETKQEIGKLRGIIQDCEFRSERAEQLAKEAEGEKDQLQQNILTCQKSIMDHQKNFNSIKSDYETQVRSLKDEIDKAKRDMANLNSALETSKRENDSERELHQVLRKHYDEMKHKFEVTSKKVFDAEEQVKIVNKQMSEKDALINRMEGIQSKLETSLGDKEAVISDFELKLAKMTDRVTQLENEKRALQKQKSDDEVLIEKLHSDVIQYKNIADMIHKMTGGASR